MSRIGRIGHNLYTGHVSYDFVGRRRTWYLISGVILVVAIAGLLLRGGLTLGVEFKGGTVFQFQASKVSVAQTQAALTGTPAAGATVVKIGDSNVQIQTEPLAAPEAAKVTAALTDKLDIKAADITQNEVGSSWGEQITAKAIQGLVIFLILVALYLAVRYEWKLALGAMIALAHDIVITIGVYALVGFEVTPATVIGFLTILGYSLYDTVVVFDKVRENTHGLVGSSKMTYSAAANLAINQTLVRSINTSIVALLPVASLLFVGSGLLGAGSLKDLALVLLIGMIAGTYSSIFVATPFAVALKEREPQMRALTKRVAARQAKPEARTAAPVAAQVGGSHGAAADVGTDSVASPARPTAARAAPQRSNRRPGGRPSGKKKRR